MCHKLDTVDSDSGSVIVSCSYVAGHCRKNIGDLDTGPAVEETVITDECSAICNVKGETEGAKHDCSIVASVNVA